MNMLVLHTDITGTGAAAGKAAEVLRSGGIAAFPTETFYGLGVRYDDPQALARLYFLKGRPHDKALPLIIGDVAMLDLLTPEVDPVVMRLGRLFWPGPLTLLLPAANTVSSLITADTGHVAVRVPGPSIALEIARRLPFPITATSANISGSPPASGAAAVERYFDRKLDLLIDGGETTGSSPSTIVSASEGGLTLLRQGVIPFEDIVRTLAADATSGE